MSVSLAISPAVMALLVIPPEVKWSYFSFTVVFAIGLATNFLRGHRQKARGIDKLLLLGPIFYAAPLAGFGTEHFTLTKLIASLVPKYIPWHLFFAYFVGTCFVLAPLSLVTRIRARLAASLLGLMAIGRSGAEKVNKDSDGRSDCRGWDVLRAEPIS